MSRAIFRAVLVVGAAWLAGCGVEPPEARHLILVTLDTLRADHVGAYGGSVETPYLDRLATEGALFEQVTAPVPLTRPSHLSLMSGRLPIETGVRDNVSPSPPFEGPLLAELLREAGFATGGFVSSVVVGATSGLDRGFERYGEGPDLAGGSAELLHEAQRRGDETLAEAVAWLGTVRQAERVFLWLHLYDPHDPYEAPAPYGERYAGRPYAGEVAWTDALVGRLLERLEGLGLADEALTVITADHGEGLGDHEELLHGFFVYESTLRVPLLVRGPGVVAGLRLRQPVALVDLFPTFLELLGVEAPAGGRGAGRSLATALQGGGEPGEAAIYAESLVPRLRFGWSELRAVRRGRWKVIEAPRPELYDLEADPGERVNLVERERGRARELRGLLRGFAAREGAATPAGEAPSEELLAQLGALGYLGGTTPASTPTPGADPKDKIEEFRLANALMREGLAQLRAGEHAAGVETLGELLERGIESAEIHLQRGRGLLDAGRSEEASAGFSRAVELEPGRAPAWLGLAETHLQLGDPEAALGALRQGARASPRDPTLRREEGRVLRLLGRLPEAREAIAAAVEIDPDDAHLRAAWAELLRGLGELEGAVAQLREAVRLAPEEASYWNALGMTLGGAGRMPEAEEAFRRAFELDDSDHRHAYNLAVALLRLGRAEEARSLLERTLALAPDFAPARQQLAALGGGP